MSHCREQRIGATCAIVGSIYLVLGTFFHPMEADPHDSVVAFIEYATAELWVASHLTQLAGVTLMVMALLILAKQLEAEGSGPWPRLGSGVAIASLAIAAALQAVDGVALKVMVNAWADASVA